MFLKLPPKDLGGWLSWKQLLVREGAAGGRHDFVSCRDGFAHALRNDAMKHNSCEQIEQNMAAVTVLAPRRSKCWVGVASGSFSCGTSIPLCTHTFAAPGLPCVA